MPVEIGELQSEVDVLGDGLPLSEAQLEQLVELVLERLEARLERRARLDRAAAITPDLVTLEPWE
jgi:hypothetical protein